jgi:hypothetical protein
VKVYFKSVRKKEKNHDQYHSFPKGTPKKAGEKKKDKTQNMRGEKRK